MLTHSRHDDGVVGRGVAQGLHHELGLEGATLLLVVGERELLLPGAQLRQPRGEVGPRRCHRAWRNRTCRHLARHSATRHRAATHRAASTHRLVTTHRRAGDRAQSQSFQSPHQLLDHDATVPGNADVGSPHLAELGGVDVDVDDLGVGGEGADLAGDPVVETAAERDEQVGVLHGGDGGVVAVHARHAEAQRVAVGERAAGHERGDDGDAGALGQLAQHLGGARLEDPAAGVDHGAGRAQDQLGGAADERGVALGLRLVAGEVELVDPGRPVPVHRGVGDVLGNVDQHRAGATRGSDVESLGDHSRQVAGVGDEPVVLGDVHGHAGDGALLEGVGADGGGGHLARDHDDGDRVHHGVGERGHDVGGPRPARHHGHTGPARHVRITLGHVPGPLLVAHQDVADRRVEDGVVHGQDGAPGEAEDDLHVLHLEALDEGLGPCQSHGVPVLVCRVLWWSSAVSLMGMGASLVEWAGSVRVARSVRVSRFVRCLGW